MRILDKIDSPGDLKALQAHELETLAQELREQIIETVNRNGGHLASPLGVVELTLALHYVYDAGRDQIIWDVGHQCYAHKLLTGRREVFDSLRKAGGISGYPKVSESPFDAFGTGHSSTSISAAVGMAVARKLRGENHHIVAVIGDGAMTAGMAMEALSHAGDLGLDLLVVLNDNEMSISPNVGALSRYFNRLITALPYKRAKEDVASFVKMLLSERTVRRIQDIEKAAKGLITHGAFFQELGFNYIGPVDGHDLPLLVAVLTNLKQMHGPILFHCHTEKGKGLRVAERDPLAYHGIKPMALKQEDSEGLPRAPEANGSKPAACTFTDAFARAVIEAAEADSRVVGITAAMPTGTGLAQFAERFPDRFFDVGICEQHAVTFAAGLAVRGLRPVAAIYSTFLQRAYDQLIHDVCLQRLPVVFAIDRAGLVGEDSPTQNGTFDLSYLRAVPELTILAPRDDVDTELMLRWALQQDGPVAIRYARSKAPTIGAQADRDVTRGQILRHGMDATLLAVGPCVAACLAAAETLAAEGWNLGVADARRVKPLDAALLDAVADRPIITVEENTLDGGFGAAVIEHFNALGRLDGMRIHRIGIPDTFSEQGTREEQLAMHGLDAKGIAAFARVCLAETPSAAPTKLSVL
ncbi:MAG: 1-deoxy-D-xylulose-5-phosphate synthase [Candidatus Hydrogenedentes bacterium]|nr:1-deoxy-D-xylulose-5-phosphate synthase [Candidatus Hydrogenedentota bacterium]